MRLTALFIFLIASLSLFAQTFTGKVKDKRGEPLVGASVVVTAEGNTIVAYCLTNDKGAYRLDVPEGKAPASVAISYMGFQKKTMPFSHLKDGMTITLAEGGFKLKEVKIKAERIQSTGDTLTYSVAGFRQGQDRSIADVIAKMPGLEVKADGKVEYQGKPISKFYIEGLDLMGTQYGVANQNISADKIKSVQVLENHQAVKSLRGVSFSEQAALNLVLKDDAKAVWTGAADVCFGYGDDFLYDCRLMGMRFNKKYQTLMMYKNNNIGKQLDNEVLDLAALLKGRTGSESGILSMMSVDAPDLADNRYTFNDSHLVAGNWLWKTGKDSELRVQGNGFIDKTKMQDYNSSTYLTLADKPVIIEEQNVSNTRSEWKGEANYQYNGSKSFIKNNLKGYIDFNKSVGTMMYNGQRTDMMVKPHKRSLTEDFQMSHTTAKGNVYNIDSYWTYSYLPGHLLTIDGMTERLNLGFFSTQNDFRYNLKIGRQYLNNEIGINYDRQSIGVTMGEADSEFFSVTASEQTNVYQLLRAYWTPSMSFLFGKHRVGVKSMISYARQSYRESKSNHLWIDPSLNWNWKATVVSEFSANIGYRNTPIMGKAIYDTPIFTSYRTLRVNRGETDATHSFHAAAAYKYSNPVLGLFFNIRPTYNRTSGNILYESVMNGNIYTTTATDKEYAMQTIGVAGRISKTFGWAKMLIGLGASHNMTDYSMLVSGEVNDARMSTITAALDYSLRPARILSVEGKSSLYFYKQNNRTTPALSSGSTTDWEHFLKLHIFPTNRWMISIKNELFHTSDKSIGTNYFLDFTVSYKAKRWELSLTANNIIGTSEFERRTLGNTIESYSVTRLRPREILAKWSVDL